MVTIFYFTLCLFIGRLVMPRGKTVARGKGVKRRRTVRVTDNDRTAALSQTEHDVVPPWTQITTSNASGPSTTFNSSVDLPNNEESYSQNKVHFKKIKIYRILCDQLSYLVSQALVL